MVPTPGACRGTCRPAMRMSGWRGAKRFIPPRAWRCCKMCRFAPRYGPFCTAIRAVLHRDTGRFTPRYRPFCRVKRHVPVNGWPSGCSAIRAAGLCHRQHFTAQSHAGRWRQARPEGGHGPGRFVMKCIWHDCLSHISGKHTLMCVHLPF